MPRKPFLPMQRSLKAVKRDTASHDEAYKCLSVHIPPLLSHSVFHFAVPNHRNSKSGTLLTRGGVELPG